jgi:hypothetical protein
MRKERRPEKERKIEADLYPNAARQLVAVAETFGLKTESTPRSTARNVSSGFPIDKRVDVVIESSEKVPFTEEFFTEFFRELYGISQGDRK